MGNPGFRAVKLLATFIVTAIVLGTIGAMALTYNVLIAGAVCFLGAGIIVGILIGICISSIEFGEDEP